MRQGRRVRQRRGVHPTHNRLSRREAKPQQVALFRVQGGSPRQRQQLQPHHRRTTSTGSWRCCCSRRTLLLSSGTTQAPETSTQQPMAALRGALVEEFRSYGIPESQQPRGAPRPSLNTRRSAALVRRCAAEALACGGQRALTRLGQGMTSIAARKPRQAMDGATCGVGAVSGSACCCACSAASQTT